jgi:hypothetical protein
MSNSAVKFRVFPVWKMDAELKWLEEMASFGYRLVKVWPTIYFFERAEPESVHFCFGYCRVKSKDRNEYFQLYADAGWQYVSSCVGWHYFRSSVATVTDMDRATVARDNAKFLKYMALICLVVLILYSLWFGFLWIRGLYYNLGSILVPGGIVIGVLSFDYLLLSYARRRQLANLEKIQPK